MDAAAIARISTNRVNLFSIFPSQSDGMWPNDRHQPRRAFCAGGWIPKLAGRMHSNLNSITTLFLRDVLRTVGGSHYLTEVISVVWPKRNTHGNRDRYHLLTDTKLTSLDGRSDLLCKCAAFVNIVIWEKDDELLASMTLHGIHTFISFA